MQQLKLKSDILSLVPQSFMILSAKNLKESVKLENKSKYER